MARTSKRKAGNAWFAISALPVRLGIRVDHAARSVNGSLCGWQGGVPKRDRVEKILADYSIFAFQKRVLYVAPR